jgi:hypothetical protein
LLYLAFHGSGDSDGHGIELEDGAVTLRWIGTQLKGRCRSAHVHFSTCATLGLEQKRLDAFRKRIGAEVVSGYSDDVGWLDSAALDLMLISRLTRHRGRVDLAIRGVRKDAAGLSCRLGFVTSPHFE